MAITIKSNHDGVSGAIQVNGVDKVTIGASGIVAGSFAPNAIAPADIAQKLTLGTSVATTSGVAIDFTGIPSWAKRITVMFNGVSTNGTSLRQVQLGSGSITTSTYSSVSGVIYNGATYTSVSSSTSGFLLADNLAANTLSGAFVFNLMSGSTWNGYSTAVASGGVEYAITGAGYVTLPGTLDRLRITTVNGTDTFDAGSVNILYE